MFTRYRGSGCPGLFARAGWRRRRRPAPAKVAVINLQRAVLESAEIKKASAEMEAKYKPRQAEMEKLQKELAGAPAKAAGERRQADAAGGGRYHRPGPAQAAGVAAPERRPAGGSGPRAQRDSQRTSRRCRPSSRRWPRTKGLDMVVECQQRSISSPRSKSPPMRWRPTIRLSGQVGGCHPCPATWIITARAKNAARSLIKITRADPGGAAHRRAAWLTGF